MVTLADFRVTMCLGLGQAKLTKVLHDFVDNETIVQVCFIPVCIDRDVDLAPHNVQVIVHSCALRPCLDLRDFESCVRVFTRRFKFLPNDLLNQIDKLTVFDLADRVESLIRVEDQISGLLLIIKGKVFVKWAAWILVHAQSAIKVGIFVVLGITLFQNWRARCETELIAVSKDVDVA